MPRTPNTNPGSHTARRQGCTCSPVENHYGLGRTTWHDHATWTIAPGCPVHDGPKSPTPAQAAA